MLLFPDDVDSLLAHLAERLEIDPRLAEACRPPVEGEAYQELITAAVAVLTERLGQKAGLPSATVRGTDWAAQIDWQAAGFAPEQMDLLVNLCRSVLDGFAAGRPAPLPATAKTGRAVLLLTDALLTELNRLPDPVQPGDLLAEFDGRSFFDELVKSLNALLPYEQRDFPTRATPTQVKLLFPDLPKGAYYAVEIDPPAGDGLGQLEVGLHFDSGDLERLTRHFQRKIPGLSHSLGNKRIILDRGENRLSVLLYQPYQPEEKLSAFRTAVTLVGFINSLHERMPRW